MKHFYNALSDQFSEDMDSGWTTCKTLYSGKSPKTRHQSVIYSAILEHESSTPTKKIEEKCQEINWYHNEPPLPDEEVTRLVNLVLKTENNGTINLEDGYLQYTETSLSWPI
jgi:hypothetical protein